MRLGFFGDGPWAENTLALLKRQAADIAFIVARFGVDNSALKLWAEKLSVPLWVPENVNDPSFVDRVKKSGASLLVSMSFDQIIRRPLIDAAPHGFLNCHAGALPFYRGRNPLNWALINDETSFGVTAHFIDEGIDTGDIVSQQHLPITDDDDYASLLRRAEVACPQVLVDAINAVDRGEAVPIVQSTIHPLGFYCGRRRQGDERLRWAQSSRALFCFVRAISDPGPCARTFLEDGRELAIREVQLVPGAPDYKATCGEVVGRVDDGVMVKTEDNVLHIKQCSWVEEGIAGESFSPTFPIGTRFNP